jgi:hypothetical protein
LDFGAAFFDQIFRDRFLSAKVLECAPITTEPCRHLDHTESPLLAITL